MFGMFSIDASEGMREQKTANDTRRVAIAKAFEDFRRDNPYATALDLQNFTDSLVGADFFYGLETQLARHWSVLRQKTKRTV